MRIGRLMAVLLLLVSGVSATADGPDEDSWDEWSKYIITNIDDMKLDIARLESKVESNHRILMGKLEALRTAFEDNRRDSAVKIAELEVKAGIYGGLAGCLPCLLTVSGFVVYRKRNGRNGRGTIVVQ